MPSRAFAAFAATYAAALLPGTRGTPSDSVRGSGPGIKKTAENGGFQGHGTPRTPGTPKNDDAGGIEAAPIVASVAVAPPQSILSLFPADPGYLARQPDRDAPAIAPSPPLADGRTAAPSPALAALGAAGEALPMPPWPDEGDAGIPRRYASATGGLLRASNCRPVSWADPAAQPSPGSWCRNCEGSGWWGNASGWRCWTCHPPDGLAALDIEEVRT